MNLKPLMLMAAISLAATGCNDTGKSAATKSTEFETDTAKISYIFGTNVGSQFKAENIELDPDAFLLGLQDAVAGNPPKLNEEETVAVLQSFQEQQLAKQEEALRVAGEANQKEGDAYLAENATKEGVVALESGLQYKVLEEGTGKKPDEEDVVEVHYRGTLIDGTEFDSSYKRGEPARFGVNQVIPGWTEALQLMKEGAKWQLVVPSQLAYGPGGTGGTIGPNQTLLFDVELLKVIPGEQESGGGEAKE